MDTDVRRLQTILRDLGLYGGPLDGLDGPATRRGVCLVLQARGLDHADWSSYRARVAAEQAALHGLGIDAGPVDGLVGPQTRYAREVYDHRLRTGRDPKPWRDDEDGPSVNVPLTWPLQRDVESFYGRPGERQVRLELPWTMRLAWDRDHEVRAFSCHERVRDAFRDALEAVGREYDAEARAEHGLDLFGGCLNVRRMRGGSAWSMHSWGIAIDFDPERNQLKWGRDRAHLARPELEAFWRIWEERGFVSLGRARNYDWMHLQAARL